MRLLIVIPTLDEEDVLAPLLAIARDLGDAVVVADGGSADQTLDIARRAGVETVTSTAGRGVQLDRGVAALPPAEEGDVLFFLHADVRPPSSAREEIRRAIGDGAVGGGFRVRYDDPPRLLAWGERWIDLRTRWSGWPLGDQGQFVRRDVFEELGGFRPWPILEDLDLVRRLARRGEVALVETPILASPRRFRRQGLLRTVALDWLIFAAYFAGVSPRRLGRLYRHVR